MPDSFPPVFLSYARSASRLHAQRLHAALGGQAAGLCFLDTSDIEAGDRLPETLVDALLNARVIVVFATPVYFERWYCWLEFELARMPALHLSGVEGEERIRALDGLVVALPGENADAVADRLPPDARVTAWPAQDQTEALAALVRARLAAGLPTHRERLAAFTDPAVERERLLGASRLPQPPAGHAVRIVGPPGLSPSIGDAFVGRAYDLWRIHAALTAGGTRGSAAGLTSAIEAGGGMGKTRLALEYFHRLGPVHFSGGLFWIDAEDAPGPQLRRVLDALDPSAPTDAELAARGTTLAEAVRDAVRARPAGSAPVLFVVDNVPEAEGDASPPPLQGWCPALGQPGVAVLATSRMRVSAPGAAVLPVPIGVLAPPDAVALLAPPGQRARLAEGEWREIAAWVGYLPLALELLRAGLHHGDIGPRELLEQSRAASPALALDEHRQALHRQIPEGHLPGVTAALSISYERLHPDARTAARMLAWIAPAPIPALVVEEVPLRFFAPEERAALVSRHFVVHPEGSPPEFFGSMHRVVADFLRRREDPEWDLRLMLAYGLTELLRDVADDQAQRVLRLRALAEPGMAALAAVHAHGLDGEALEHAVNFGATLFVAAEEEGQLAIARDVGERLLPLVPRHYGAEHDETLAFLRRLVMVYAGTGDVRRARDFAAAHAVAFRDTLEELDAESLTVQVFQGLALADEGRYDDAEALLDGLFATAREGLGETHELPLMIRSLRAFILTMRGRPREALPLLEGLVGEAQAAAEPDALAVLVPRMLLEITREHAGAPRASAAEIRFLAQATRATLGDHHPLTLAARQMEEAEEAEEAGRLQSAAEWRTQLAALRADYGPDHFTAIAAERELARQLEREGDHEAALSHGRAMAEAIRGLKGEGSMDALNAAVWLGSMLRRMGRVAQAREMHQEALKAFEAEFGEEHPDTIDAMKALALTLKKAKDPAGAQRLQERVLALYARTLGDEHPHTFAAALDVYGTAVDRFDLRHGYRTAMPWMGILGATHPDLLSPEMRVLQERFDREFPLPGFYRRTIRNRVLERSREDVVPGKPWWKFW